MSSPMSAPEPPFALRFARAIVTAIGFSALAAGCANIPADWPVHLTNEAYPQAPPDGYLGTPSYAGSLPPDTANIAHPTSPPVGGRPVVVVRSQQ